MQNTPPIPESAVSTHSTDSPEPRSSQHGTPGRSHDSHNVATGHRVVSSTSTAATTYAAFFDACTGVRPVALNDSPDMVWPVRSFWNEYGDTRALISWT